MRVFKTKVFGRFARRAGVGDATLRAAIADVERGLVDADLGGGVIKQRVARQGAGKSGGFRTIILFRAGLRAVFVYGFGKNERDNIDDDELAEFRRLATPMLSYGEAEIARAVQSGALVEVDDDEAIP